MSDKKLQERLRERAGYLQHAWEATAHELREAADALDSKDAALTEVRVLLGKITYRLNQEPIDPDAIDAMGDLIKSWLTAHPEHP